MRVDVAIVGAGIAGASLAAELAPHLSVLLIESEDQPGYHSTGRSAAFWSETYGGPGIQPLTTASFAPLRDGGFLEPLGSIKLARAGDAAAIDAFLAEFDGSGVALERIDPRDRIPGLRAEWCDAVFEPSCAYIDVGGLHGALIGAARRAGATLWMAAALTAAVRVGTDWHLETRAGTVDAGIVVNAAGGWADAVAALAGVAPVGLTAYRRTLVQLRTDPAPPRDLPHVSEIGGSFYFKPEGADRLWLSPHDETPVPPGDVQPEEIDVAIAIDRFEGAVDWRVVQVERKWAGLRTFAPDRLPVYGFDRRMPGFFWCVGQGGFGIQTAPAAAALAAGLILDRPNRHAIDPTPFSPDRFAVA